MFHLTLINQEREDGDQPCGFRCEAWPAWNGKEYPETNPDLCLCCWNCGCFRECEKSHGKTSQLDEVLPVWNWKTVMKNTACWKKCLLCASNIILFIFPVLLCFVLQNKHSKMMVIKWWQYFPPSEKLPESHSSSGIVLNRITWFKEQHFYLTTSSIHRSSKALNE